MVKSPEDIVRRARQALRQVREDGREDAVHDLRTGLRRIEALSDAGLPKRIKRLRKQAGSVRDYDVLRKLLEKLDVARIDPDGEKRLRKSMDKARRKGARKLAVLAKKIGGAKLKEWSDKHMRPPDHGTRDVVSDLEAVLRNPDYQNPGRNNLHNLRLEIKPLRYRAELFNGRQAREVERRLNQMQTAIGDWHDLVLLSDFAEETLGGSGGEGYLKIRGETEKRYERCLAEVLRQRKAFQKLAKQLS